MTDESINFPNPFDSDQIMEPYNETWAQRRLVNRKLKQLANQLVTRPGNVDKLQQLEGMLDGALEVLADEREIHGRKGWFEDPEDFGNYRVISREITPLSGNSNVMAPPIHIWFDREQQKSFGRVTLDWMYEGPPNCVHGGIVAALFDDFLGCTQLLCGNAGATGTLSLHYHKPTPLNTELMFEGYVDYVKGRKICCKGDLVANGERLVTGEGLFIAIKEGVMQLSDRQKKDAG
jgi:hypothetical protein